MMKKTMLSLGCCNSKSQDRPQNVPQNVPIVDFLRRKDKQNTLLLSLVHDKHQLAISIITHSELYAGKSVWKRKEANKELETLFSGMDMLPLSEEISKKAGEIKARHNTNLFDAIIAATAIAWQLKLVTLNRKNFENIDKISLFTKK